MRARVAALVGLLVAAALAVFWWGARGGDAEVAARPVSATAGAAPDPASGGRPTTPSEPPRAPSRHVRRLTAEQRKDVAAQIAAARAARAAAAEAPADGAAAPGAPAERRLTVERVSSPVKSALEESIPILAECYRRAGQRPARAAVMMSLVGDPSVGTLVDPSEMVDADRKPLPPALDRCLRDTFLSLELPPLDEGDKLDLQYSFEFDD